MANFTRRQVVAGGLGVLASLGLAACGSSSSTSAGSATASADLEKLTVGASPTPHAEILNAVKDELAAAGYELEVVEYNDYVQPNVALNDGDLDANYFQHQPYLDNYNEENGTDLVGAAAIHYEPFGLYAGKTASLDAIADGAQIAVPGDGSNETRALLLLQDAGLITLAEGINATSSATKTDIVDNPHNIDIVETEAASVARALEDVDFAVINGNYAIEAGLSIADALASESADSDAAQTYANVVATRNGDESSDKTKALIAALTSDTAKAFVEEEFQGSVVLL